MASFEKLRECRVKCKASATARLPFLIATAVTVVAAASLSPGAGSDGPARNATEANQNTNDIFRDIGRVGTWQWALDWTAGGAQSPVYTYFWTHGAAEEPDNGAYHGSEL
ncbi:hypothetical protein BDV19DRAFT_386363 [Aspergillus venezuelensis]